MKTLITLFLIIFFISSCSPKIGSNIISKQPALSDTDAVLVLEQQDKFFNDGIEIGTIKSADNGLSINCSYEDVVATLTKMARKYGANVVKINKYKDPDQWSSCVRLTANIYRVPDVEKHEIIITWSGKRRLKWDDFKATARHGSDEDVAAQTYCAVKYKGIYVRLFGQGEIHVSNIFYCDSSWVDSQKKYSLELLEHEQGHFDLCEVYARMFRQKIRENKLSVNNPSDLDDVFYAIMNQYRKRQDLYDEQTKHGLNRKNQLEWINEINEELNKLSSFTQ
jgi:hypothetical protein